MPTGKKSKPKKKNNSAIGNIYYVDPKHLIKPEDMADYSLARNTNKKRPVMVTVQKRNDGVQISKMTTVKPTKKQIDRYQKVKLDDESKLKAKDSYLDTRTMSKSEATNKKFKLGEDPLKNSPRKASNNDINNVNKARKKRWPGIR